ncbi:MAG: ribonuclease Z [Candidatus Omnitrophota bacterium]
MRVIFLGTMGWYDGRLGNTLCVLVDTPREYIVFDAGSGFSKIDNYIKGRKPVYLFLSHFHLDHIIGLHTLNKLVFPQGINIFGPKGTRKMFNLVINTPYSKPIHKLKLKVRVEDITRDKKFPFDIKYARLLHTSLCYGYRLSVNGKTLAFCTDTGPCKQMQALSKNADLLIAESSLPPGTIDTGWPHLNPEQAAMAARAAKAKKLVLAHFDAGDYLKESDIRLAEKSARKIFKGAIAARDGFCLEL